MFSKWYTHTHGYADIGQPAKAYTHQLCVDARACLEDLLKAMVDMNRGQERIKRIHAVLMLRSVIYQGQIAYSVLQFS